LSYKRRLPSAGTPAILKATSRFNFEATESSESDASDCVESYSKKRAHSELLGEKNKPSCTGLDEESKDEISELLSRVSNNWRASDAALNTRSCKQLNEEDICSYKPEKNKLVSSQRKSIRSFRKRMYSRKNSSQNVQQVWALSGWESLARALARVGVEDYLGKRDSDMQWKSDFSSILKPPPSPQALMRLVTEDVQGVHNPEEKEPRTCSASKKSVSFGGLPQELSVKNSSDCVQLMRSGHYLNKMRSSSRVYKRYYWFDQLSNCIRWQPSKKDNNKATISINSIREVRSGKNTRMFHSSEISSMFVDDCSFSIIHCGGCDEVEESLDLIAGSPDEANVWITGIRFLLTPGLQLPPHDVDDDQFQPTSDPRDQWLAQLFDRADHNHDGYLDAQESLDLITEVSDGVKEKRVKQKLSEYMQMNGKSNLSRLQFVQLFKDVTTRPEIYFLLARYSSVSSDQLSINDLKLFLEAEQGHRDITDKKCIEIIEKFEPSSEAREIPALGIDGFTKYLMSEECALTDPKHKQVCQDMSQPLSSYFISASHNTYLMEDQMRGPCSHNAYVRALLRCCRCIEVDVWDGSNGEPQVTHGHTQTNSTPLFQVLEAIEAAAFRNSKYPVILKIENHCNVEQQLKMCEYITSVFKDKLFLVDDIGSASDLPSPQDLIHKIIISSKKLPFKTSEPVEADYVIDDDEGANVKLIAMQQKSDVVMPSHIEDASSVSSLLSTRRRHLLTNAASKLVVVCRDQHLYEDNKVTDFRFQSKQCKSSTDIYSIQEDSAFNLIEKYPMQLCDFTRKNLTRVYPNPERIDSTNFNAQDAWNCGVQITSLNYQTPGLVMDINDGRFSMNGGCGYVLKPNFIRDDISYYSPAGPQPASLSKMLHLRIISGQNFPKPRNGGAKGHVIDPYVLVELFGVEGDCGEERTRTCTNDNGVSPQFDSKLFTFNLTVPSLVLVRFVVLDDDFIGDEFIGQYTVPLECLQLGYRHLSLRSIYDEPLEGATLFVHVAFSQVDSPLLSPNLCTRQSSIKRNGGQSSAQQQPSKKKSRSLSQSNSLVGGKEPAAIHLQKTHLREFDDVFESVSSQLGRVAAIRDVVRGCMQFFRDSCGLPNPTHVKKCIRNLHERSRGIVLKILKKNNGSMKLEFEGGGETWKRVQESFRSLVTEMNAVVSMSTQLKEELRSKTVEIEKLYERFSEIYAAEFLSPPLLQSSLVRGSSSSVSCGSESSKKQSSKKKKNDDKAQKSTDHIGEVRNTIRWNYSLISASMRLTAILLTHCTETLEDLWQGALTCGIGQLEDTEVV